MTERRRVSTYQVGYKRPPKDTQFKPGQSGNSSGRPKGSRNFSTLLDQELNIKVPITERGSTRRISKRHVIVKQMVNKAAGGDLKAASMLMGGARDTDPPALETAREQPLLAEDRRTFDSFLARARQSQQVERIAAPTRSDISDAPPSPAAGPGPDKEPRKRVRAEILK